MLLACSHVLLASDDVPRITRFFAAAFDLTPRFENDMFAEFVLPSRFRLVFVTMGCRSALRWSGRRGATPRC